MPKENSTHQVDPMDKWVSIEQAANYLGSVWLRFVPGCVKSVAFQQSKLESSGNSGFLTLKNGSPAEAANSVLTKRKNKKDDRFPKELVIFFIRKS